MKIKNYTPKQNLLLTQMLRQNKTVAEISRALDKKYSTVWSTLSYRKVVMIDGVWKF